ncbi:MAG: MerR family transcriptional regulator [Stackebrandtia sp.]
MDVPSAPLSGHSIGAASRRSGFSMDTLRYYDKIGLLGDIGRSASGRRVFSEADLSLLGMLKCLRDTGMPVAEMLRFAELARAGDHTVPQRLKLLEDHHARVDADIADLRAKQAAVAGKIDHYRTKR